MSDGVFACDMTALSRVERATHARTIESLFGAVQRIDEASAGYVFHLSATRDRIQEVAEFITLERLCCPFFDFFVELPGSQLRLAVTGTTGVKPFIQAEFGPALSPAVRFPE